MIHIFGPKDNPPDCLVINTTTSSKTWSRELSPMILGPVNIAMAPHAYKSKKMENAWQFSKVYPNYVDENQNPTAQYWEWATKGFSDNWAHRYPMGKNVKPLYSLCDGQKYNYVEARKYIYIPLYAQAVTRTQAFKLLRKDYENNSDIALFDFDGYSNQGLTWEEILNDPKKKMGHAFVLGMLLEGIL